MRSHRVRGAIEVEAELKAPNTLVQLVRYHFSEPPDSKLRVEGRFRLDLCLTERHRSARACFCDQWNRHRFERIGALFLVPPALDMLARSDEDYSLASIVCELNREPVLELFDSLPELTEQHLLASLDIRDAKLRVLLLRLAEEARHPGFASELLVESIAMQMAVELFRLGTTITERQLPGGLAPWQLRLIEERLREVCEAPTLTALAAQCHLSVRQLSRGFRASRGCSIGAYVAASQMEHAKSLLATDAPVAAIASTLGFSSSSNFCFSFRRAMGMTPGQFRANVTTP
ncbi:MAG TPA: helix-turn-helix transcriptional regulator [Steroidobacteraceae bacterium]|nr:helix-turn-helix transcriptional regulator [Steroidobacteraceae bacterium]HUA26603.1 helix-turn-helix transcriptional regulator [Steroidobacteraceae bacterium]